MSEIDKSPKALADRCEQFRKGAKRLYDSAPNEGDMWFFELYHHLSDCAEALRRTEVLSELGQYPY